MTYYSKEISLPATKREGLENFLQIIINKLEARGKPAHNVKSKNA